MTRKATAYIDGFNLFHGMREAGLKHCYWLNIEILMQHYLAPLSTLDAVYYFTARLPASDSAEPRQRKYLDALTTLHNTHIIAGRFNFKDQRCPACGSTYRKPQEKKTDVNLACTMVRHAIQHETEVILLVTGDNDLTPAFQTISMLKPSVTLLLALPPQRNKASELAREADKVFSIKEADLIAAQLPDPVNTNGYSITKPGSWL